MKQNYATKLTPEAHQTLTDLFKSLGLSGQRGASFSPGLQHLADAAVSAPVETRWLMDILFQVAGGGDLSELLEFTPLPAIAE